MENTKLIRIGNASGFWGDEPTALRQQLSGGPLDYVVLDYLAEVSMSILAKQQAKQPELGYIPDFLEHLEIAKDFLHLPVKIVTNAGGNNPKGCAMALSLWAKKQGLSKKIYYVEGDDIFPFLTDLNFNEIPLQNMENGQQFSSIANRVTSANAYTSAEGIVDALSHGADWVICGRCSDSALVIGPLRYEMGWKQDEYDKLGAAMVAGHLIECGAQATGGNFTDWQKIPSMENMGFPIVECMPNGDFYITKHPQTGGMVTEETVKEQLVYEIADPKRYWGPDVVADLTQITVTQIGSDKVLVQGCKGIAPPKTWKVSMSYHDGFKCVGGLMLSGPDVFKKAEKTADLFWNKLGLTFEKRASKKIGFDSIHQSFPNPVEPNELLLQLVAFDKDKSKLNLFSKQIAATILVGPQGLAATGGRPKVQEVYRYWPTNVPSQSITLTVGKIGDNAEAIPVSNIHPFQHVETLKARADRVISPTLKVYNSAQKQVKLREIALGRSGDKGNTSNIGILARSPEIYEYLWHVLTEQRVKAFFANDCHGVVTRFELPRLSAFNFVLTEILDGGGTYAATMDPQGKTLGSTLLEMKIEIPIELLETIKG